MKNRFHILAGFLFTILAAQSAFAGANYECDNQDVASGKYFVGSHYNVVVGTDFETGLMSAMVYSRAVAPNPPVNETTLVSKNGAEDATFFAKDDYSFTVSSNGNAGALTLHSEKITVLCTTIPITGAVTGHN